MVMEVVVAVEGMRVRHPLHFSEERPGLHHGGLLLLLLLILPPPLFHGSPGHRHHGGSAEGVELIINYLV